MPEDEKKDEQGGIKIEDVVKSLESKIDEKVGANNQRFDSLEQKLDDIKTIQTHPQTPQTPAETPSEEEDDDDPMSKKEVKKKISEIKSEVIKEAKKIASETYETNSNKRNLDEKAFKDYPMMNQQSDSFDPEFLNDIKAEIRSRKEGGDDADRSSFINDVAATVYSKWNRDGKIVSQKDAEEENQRLNNQDSSFNVKGRRDVKTGKPNASQYEFAEKMGLEKETFDKYYNPPKKK